MPFFAVGVALALALISLLLYRRLAVATRLPDAARRWVALGLGLGWLSAVVAFAMQSGLIDPHRARWAAWAGMTWLAVVWYLLLGVLMLGVLALAARIATQVRDRRTRRSRRTDSTDSADSTDCAEDVDSVDTANSSGSAGREVAAGRPAGLRLLRAGTVAVVVAALVTTAYGVHEAAQPQVTTATFTSALLPKDFDGLRIALVSDLHVGPVREESFTRRVVEQVNAQHPDLVVLAGDLSDGTVEQVGDSLTPLRDLRAPFGVVAVSGNHEFISGEADAWMRHWQSLGITVLRNEHVTLQRGATSLHVAGVNDETARENDAPNVGAALAGVTPSDFTVLVAHQPKTAESAQRRNIGLQLSGHTHGGQLWPFRYVVTLQQPMLDGFALVGDVSVFAGRGAGAWGPPVRVLAPPQLPIITLRRA